MDGGFGCLDMDFGGSLQEGMSGHAVCRFRLLRESVLYLLAERMCVCRFLSTDFFSVIDLV